MLFVLGTSGVLNETIVRSLMGHNGFGLQQIRHGGFLDFVNGYCGWYSDVP